jgi:hypothetical protein
VDEVLNMEYLAVLIDFLILHDFSYMVFACLDFCDDCRSLNVLIGMLVSW